MRHNKREGDGATPYGQFPLRRVFYRADRVDKPVTGLPVAKLRPRDGWCDDPSHMGYNQFVQRPFNARHEMLWRADRLYDVIIEVGYNDSPVRPGHGSAIFIHIASPDYGSTEGCIALAAEDLFPLLRRCNRHTILAIGPRP